MTHHQLEKADTARVKEPPRADGASVPQLFTPGDRSFASAPEARPRRDASSASSSASRAHTRARTAAPRARGGARSRARSSSLAPLGRARVDRRRRTARARASIASDRSARRARHGHHRGPPRVDGDGSPRSRVHARGGASPRADARGARLLVLDGEVFDFEGFAHPGGTRALDRHAGEDVSALFRGEVPADDDGEASARDDHLHDANDAARPRATFASRPHAHGPAARRILRALRVGRIDPEDPRPLRATDRAGLRLDDRGEDRSSVGSAGSDDDDDEPKDVCAGKMFSSSDAASSDAASTPSDLGAVGPQSDLGARGGAQRRGGLVRFAASLAPPAYREWVHSPTHSSEPLRFFDNDAFEALTRTSWWVVPLVWVPVGISALATATRRGAEATPFTRYDDATPTRCREEERIAPPLFGSDGSEDLFLLWSLRVSLLVAFALGVLSWSLLEYGFHRFVFHASPRTSLGCAAHFILHGCHHKAPTDAKRLVFPLPRRCAGRVGRGEGDRRARQGGRRSGGRRVCTVLRRRSRRNVERVGGFERSRRSRLGGIGGYIGVERMFV